MSVRWAKQCLFVVLSTASACACACASAVVRQRLAPEALKAKSWRLLASLM